MNWLTNYVKPKLSSVLKRDDTSETKWCKCGGCGNLIFHKDYLANLSVCAKCGHHGRVGAAERFGMIFDKGQYELVELPEAKDDPLKFKDKKRYSERLGEARAKTGSRDALQVALGRLGGYPAVVGVQDFFFMAGSMGVGVGDAFLVAVKAAIENHAPFIIFTSAGGARMQEGILSLMQMPRAAVALEMLEEEGLPYIVVLTDPTTGGVTASYAMLGDVQFAEPGALIGFAGPRVIENTIREKLPEGFQRSEYLKDHGMVDRVVDRKDLRDELITVVSLFAGRKAPSQERPLARV